MVLTSWRRQRRATAAKGLRPARLVLETLEERVTPSANFVQDFETDNTGFNLSTADNATNRFTSNNDAGSILDSSVPGLPASQPGSTHHGEVAGGLQLQNSSFGPNPPDGVTVSASGSAITPFGPTRATGYTSTFPTAGYGTFIDVFLDPTGAVQAQPAEDSRFDVSSAINDNTGAFRRDFVFNAGFYNAADTDGPGAGLDRFVISAGSNAGRANSFPKDPNHQAQTGSGVITDTGWYTFSWVFSQDANGKLQVDMSVTQKPDPAHPIVTQLPLDWTFNADNTPALAGDVVSGPGANIGGNRYLWFASQELPKLYIDNVVKATSLPAISGITFSDDASLYSGIPDSGGNISDQPGNGTGNGDPDGQVQHSMIRVVTIAFNGQLDPSLIPVDTQGGLASTVDYDNTSILGGAISLSRLPGAAPDFFGRTGAGATPDAPYTFKVTVDHTLDANGNSVLKLYFFSAEPNQSSLIVGDSLADGNYSLTVLGAKNSGVRTDQFWRLYGDVNGDRAVNTLDKAAFDAAYLSMDNGSGSGTQNYRSYLDYDLDGFIAGVDSDGFQSHYKKRLNTDGSYTPLQ